MFLPPFGTLTTFSGGIPPSLLPLPLPTMFWDYHMGPYYGRDLFRTAAAASVADHSGGRTMAAAADNPGQHSSDQSRNTAADYCPASARACRATPQNLTQFWDCLDPALPPALHLPMHLPATIPAPGHHITCLPLHLPLPAVLFWTYLPAATGMPTTIVGFCHFLLPHLTTT